MADISVSVAAPGANEASAALSKVAAATGQAGASVVQFKNASLQMTQAISKAVSADVAYAKANDQLSDALKRRAQAQKAAEAATNAGNAPTTSFADRLKNAKDSGAGGHSGGSFNPHHAIRMTGLPGADMVANVVGGAAAGGLAGALAPMIGDGIGALFSKIGEITQRHIEQYIATAESRAQYSTAQVHADRSFGSSTLGTLMGRREAETKLLSFHGGQGLVDQARASTIPGAAAAMAQIYSTPGTDHEAAWRRAQSVSRAGVPIEYAAKYAGMGAKTTDIASMYFQRSISAGELGDMTNRIQGSRTGRALRRADTMSAASAKAQAEYAEGNIEEITGRQFRSETDPMFVINQEMRDNLDEINRKNDNLRLIYEDLQAHHKWVQAKAIRLEINKNIEQMKPIMNTLPAGE